MDETSRGIATAALTLQSVLLQALVHKGVLTPDEAMTVADKAVAAARERSDEDEESTADISAACLEEVREGLAAMGSEYPSGPVIDAPGTGRSKASRLGELIGRRVGRAMRNGQKPDDE